MHLIKVFHAMQIDRRLFSWNVTYHPTEEGNKHEFLMHVLYKRILHMSWTINCILKFHFESEGVWRSINNWSRDSTFFKLYWHTIIFEIWFEKWKVKARMKLCKNKYEYLSWNSRWGSSRAINVDLYSLRNSTDFEKIHGIQFAQALLETGF